MTAAAGCGSAEENVGASAHLPLSLSDIVGDQLGTCGEFRRTHLTRSSPSSS
jgi:hypothetical protein